MARAGNGGGNPTGDADTMKIHAIHAGAYKGGKRDTCLVAPLFEGDDPAEQVDMIVGSFGGTGPLQRYAVDSRRFQPFQGV